MGRGELSRKGLNSPARGRGLRAIKQAACPRFECLPALSIARYLSQRTMAQRKTSCVEPLYAAIGARIAELRVKRGLTQEDLARRADLSPNYIARTEGAYHRPTLAKLAAIAEALGVSLIDLLASTQVPIEAAVLRALGSALNALAEHDQRLVLQIARRLRRSTATRGHQSR